MLRKIRKAVITAAGRGTRFLPITKVVPKELLPIGNQPTLYYLLKEAKDSGIEEVCIVLRERGSLTEKYFEHDVELEAYLQEKNKPALLEAIANPSLGMKVSFVAQDQTLPIGHGAPVLSAKDWIAGEAFALFFCDDLIKADVPGISQLISSWEANTDLAGIVQTVSFSAEKILNTFSSVKYRSGVERNAGGYTVGELENYIEKPKTLDQIFSTDTFIGRAVYSAEILMKLEANVAAKRAFDGEFSLWDAMIDLAQEKPVAGQRLVGEWLTTGNQEQMQAAAQALLG